MSPIRFRWIPTFTVILALAILGAGCARKPQAAAPAAPAAPPAAPEKPAPAPTPTPPPAPAPAPKLAAADFDDVFFDFDSSVLRTDGRAALDKDAKLLRDHPEAKVRLEGHCDERGTIEYNMALGEKRADAVREYLVGAGVEAARISTVSYGKEQPFCTGHDESCWQQNRRAHVVLLPTGA